MSNKWYKNNNTDKIWWQDNPDQVGAWLFLFDKQTVFNIFEDYPYKLTKEQKLVFDEENAEWKDFFQDRQ